MKYLLYDPADFGEVEIKEDTRDAEITRLREELAAVTERMSKLDFERTAAELERDALREKNELLMQAWNEEKGFLNKYIDKIEYLREENARLREALAPLVDAGNFKVSVVTAITEEECFVSINVKERDLRRARAAILGKVKDEAACPAPDEAP